MWKNFTIVLTAMLVLQLCFQVSVLFADNNSSWRITFQRSASHEKTGHTIPTLLSVVDDATGEYIYALDNPLYEALKTSKFVTIHNETEEYMSKVQLQLDRKTIRPRENVTVSWSHQSDLVNDDDILLLYCGDHTKYADINFHQFLDAATILQARATSNKHFITTAEKYQHRNQWYFPSFPVVGYNACRFGLFQNRLVSNNAIKLVALSTVLHIGNGTELPSELHLALGDTIDTMMVQFQTGAKGAPVVRYGMSPDALLLSATGSSHTYTAQDMCQKPATQVEPGKFQPPGFLHQVTLTHLEPNRTYHYQVGLKEDSGKTTWSATISRFVSAPKVEVDAEPFSFVVYGDQGCPSDGWGQGGTWTAAMTTREVDGVSNNNPIRMVHHMGDLSYAKVSSFVPTCCLQLATNVPWFLMPLALSLVSFSLQGAAHIWDEWFNMIEPFASRVPLLVAGMLRILSLKPHRSHLEASHHFRFLADQLEITNTIIRKGESMVKILQGFNRLEGTNLHGGTSTKIRTENAEFPLLIDSPCQRALEAMVSFGTVLTLQTCIRL